MRVIPPVPFNGRTATTNTWLPVGGGPEGGAPILVKKGQKVIFAAWGSHRSTETYGSDAHTFKPERWSNIKADGFIPFNLGPRACPGRKCQHLASSSG
jgi:cytochrome P450